MAAKKKQKEAEDKFSKWVIIGFVIFLGVVILLFKSNFQIKRDSSLKITPTIFPSPTIFIPTPMGDKDRENYIKTAKEELGKMIKINEDKIEVLEVEAVDWPNSSLGCPKKGGIYLQIIVPGYRIKLKALNKEYVFHAGLNRVIICQKS